MKFFPNQRSVVNFIFKSVVVGISLLVLAVSVARAGWEIWAKNNNQETQANNLIQFTAVFSDGETAPETYKLPEIGLLPDQMFYGLKKIRDYLWLSFSKGDAKIKMALLLGDKSMAESMKMMEAGKYDKSLEAGNEAMDKLEYAGKLINKTTTTGKQTQQLHRQIFWAGYAYKEVVEKMQDAFGLDTEKFLKLVTRINEWNKEQEKERYNWDY